MQDEDSLTVEHDEPVTTLPVELAHTAAERHADVVAEDFRKLGKQAYDEGVAAQQECERFACELEASVKEMEDYVKSRLKRIRRATDLVRAAKVSYNGGNQPNEEERPA
jgi:hypothetical protein